MATYRDYKLAASPEEVLRRLQTAIGPDSFWGVSDASENSVVGIAGYGSFRLRVKHWWNNSFAPIIHGTVKDFEGGSRVTIRLSYHRMVTGMLVLWYGLCALIPLINALGIDSTCFRWRGGGDPWKNSLIAAGVTFGAT